MIKITNLTQNRIDMEFNASSIDEETMRRAIEELIEKSKGIEHGQLLYRLHHFPWPSLSAMAVKFNTCQNSSACSQSSTAAPC